MSEDTRGPERWLWHELAQLIGDVELARLQAGFRERSRAAGKRTEAKQRRAWLAGAKRNLGMARYRKDDAATIKHYEKHVARHRAWLNKYGFSEEETNDC